MYEIKLQSITLLPTEQYKYLWAQIQFVKQNHLRKIELKTFKFIWIFSDGNLQTIEHLSTTLNKNLEEIFFSPGKTIHIFSNVAVSIFFSKKERKHMDSFFIYSFLKFFFLMWIIFKVFVEFVTILLLFYAFWPQGMWDLTPQPGIKPALCTKR